VSFLAPWFLLLGGAALVPLLIHLLRRRIGLQVEFPAARYLARAERDHSRTLRMRNLLLMLLRVLAVLLLAAAASRPSARLAGAAGGHAPTALAIVLDNSMSTSVVEDGAPLIEQFKRMASEAIGQATADDRIWLVTADATLRGGSPATMREELERIRSYPGAGRMREAVARAAAAVEASGLQSKQVIVLTDGQRTTWSEPAQLRGTVRVLVWAPGTQPPVNRAVTVAEPRPLRWTPRGAIATRAMSEDSTTYRIALGPRTLARGTVAPGEEAPLRAAPPERGWTAGTVEIQPDELPMDNVRHFALWIGAPPTVQVLPGAGTFVKNAVDVLQSNERVAIGGGSAIQIASADEASTLPALLTPPLDPVRLGAANRTLERLGVPWRFGEPRREASIARGEQTQGVAVTTHYQLLPRGVPDAETLAVVGREPWIVSGPRYVLLGSPLDPNATSFPVSAAFLPWLGDVLASRLHSDPGGIRYAAPGDRVTRLPGVDAIESAAGGRTSVANGASFDAPAVAGTYFHIQGTRRVGALVVNPEPDESRLDRWRPNDLAEHVVSSSGARLARDRDEWVRLAFSATSRRPLAGVLMVAILLTLGAEMLLATTGGRAKA
jgi:hypothetical protein